MDSSVFSGYNKDGDQYEPNFSMVRVTGVAARQKQRGFIRDRREQ